MPASLRQVGQAVEGTVVQIYCPGGISVDVGCSDVFAFIEVEAHGCCHVRAWRRMFCGLQKPSERSLLMAGLRTGHSSTSLEIGFLRVC